MSTINLRIKYRPVKIGWCVKDNDFAAVRKAVRMSNVLWGGQYNPIIPVSQVELAKQLVSTFRVDVLYPCTEDKEVKDFIESFPHLPYPFYGKKLFRPANEGTWESEALDVYHAIKQLYDEHFKNVAEPKFKAKIYQWAEEDTLADVFLMTFGAYPTPDQSPENYEEILKQYLSAEVINIENGASHPKDVWKQLTPYIISGHNLNYHYSVQNHWSYPGFYIGNAQDFMDLINYWNVRASGCQVCFYDLTAKERFTNLMNEYIDDILALPPRLLRNKSRIALWAKSEEILATLKEFGEEKFHCIVDDHLWNGLNIKPPYAYFSEKSVLASVNNDGQTTVAFQLPEMPFEDGIETHGQHVVISINQGIGLFGNDIETLSTPYLPELNEYYGRKYFHHWDKVRVEPESIGIIEDIGTTSISIRALNVGELISKIFEIKEVTAKPSQPGILCRHLIAQMGGLRSCSVFKIKGVRELIEKYKVTESFTRSGAIQCIRQAEGGVVGFSKYENLYIEQRNTPKLTPDNALTYLLKKKAFRPGLEFKCPSCQLDFWLSIDDSKSTIPCEYCGNSFDVTTQLKDRGDWRFRRSGLLSKENHQEGAIPVILLLEQLQNTSSLREGLYTTATKLKKTGDSAIDCETDFIFVDQRRRDLRLQVAIGECKNHQEITDEDVENMRSVINELKDMLDVYVIFVKLTTFTEAEIARCATLNDKYHRRVILLTDRELEPYRLYEDTAKEYKIKGYANSLEDMANITQHIYYSDANRREATPSRVASENSSE